MIEAAELVPPDVEITVLQREFRETRILRDVVTRSGIRPEIIPGGKRILLRPMSSGHQPQGCLGDQQRRRNPQQDKGPVLQDALHRRALFDSPPRSKPVSLTMSSPRNGRGEA